MSLVVSPCCTQQLAKALHEHSCNCAVCVVLSCLLGSAVHYGGATNIEVVYGDAEYRMNAVQQVMPDLPKVRPEL